MINSILQWSLWCSVFWQHYFFSTYLLHLIVSFSRALKKSNFTVTTIRRGIVDCALQASSPTFTIILVYLCMLTYLLNRYRVVTSQQGCDTGNFTTLSLISQPKNIFRMAQSGFRSSLLYCYKFTKKNFEKSLFWSRVMRFFRGTFTKKLLWRPTTMTRRWNALTASFRGLWN